MKSGIKIMILEGSEILKNNLENKSIEKDYKGVFADSLLLDKLKNTGLNTYNDTTKDIVMLNFGYGYTNEKVSELYKSIYKSKTIIKTINKLDNDIKLHRKEKKGNNEKKVFTDILYLLNRIKSRYKEKNDKLIIEIKQLNMSKKEVRKKLYRDGFKLDFYRKDRDSKEYKKEKTIEYCFWFRTPSKSRTGDVIFINKKLYNKINNWQTMNIKLPQTNAQIVEMEAYKSLTASHIEDKITINPQTEILVVDDLDSYRETMCTKVYVNDEGECKVSSGVFKLKNTLFDGQALLDDSYFDDNSGMKLLRQHFFKACGFRTYIQKFFMDYCEKSGLDYDTYKVKDRYGNKLLAKNIRMITTENAMKWEKFNKLMGNSLNESYTYWKDRVMEDSCIFGVCKTDHPSKYGDYQRMSYQMINTLPINQEQCLELCKETVDYVNSLKANDEVYLDYLNKTKSDINSNEMMIKLYQNNKNFKNSAVFRKYRYRTISAYKYTLKAGKLLVNGDNLTIVGNPYTMLLHSVGELNKYICNNVLDGYEDITLPKFKKESGELEYVSVYTERFEHEEYLASFRNPHNSPNNIGYNKNFKHNLMKKYFNFSKNIMAVNMIETDEQDRKNGEDQDSDFNFVTNSKVVVKASKTAQEYPTIVNCIEKSGKTYNNTPEDLAIIDNGLAEAKYSIGLSSNLAQLAMSWYWKDKTKELADIVAIMSVLAQCAIDNSKRLYKVNLNSEIARIRKLECMQVKINVNGKLLSAKPYFWQFVKCIKEEQEKKIKEKDKNKKLELKINQKEKAVLKKKEKELDVIRHCIDEKVCPMDFIQDGIEKIDCSNDKSKYIKDIEFIRNIGGNEKANNRQKKVIEDIITDLDNIIKEHNDKMENDNSEKWIIEQQFLINSAINKIKKLKIKPKTMEMLIRDSLNRNKKYKLKMLNCLFKSYEDMFLECFNKQNIS